MPRQRMIHPEIWESRQVSSLTDFEFRVWTGLISWADDEGRLGASPIKLTAHIFPYASSLDMVTDLQNAICIIESKLDATDNYPLVGIYQHGSEAFLFHPNWSKWQYQHETRKTKSKLPPPPKGMSKYGKHRITIEPYGYGDLLSEITPIVC